MIVPLIGAIFNHSHSKTKLSNLNNVINPETKLSDQVDLDPINTTIQLNQETQKNNINRKRKSNERKLRVNFDQSNSYETLARTRAYIASSYKLTPAQ